MKMPVNISDVDRTPELRVWILDVPRLRVEVLDVLRDETIARRAQGGWKDHQTTTFVNEFCIWGEIIRKSQLKKAIETNG